MLKKAALASLAGLLIIIAVASTILAITYAADDSPRYLLCAIIALPSLIAGKVLFWVIEYKGGWDDEKDH